MVSAFIAGAKVDISLTFYRGQHNIFNMVIVISLPEILFHLPAPVRIGQGILLRGVLEQRQDHLAFTPIFLLLSIRGMSEPVLLPLSLVMSMITVLYIGPMGLISIVPVRLIRRVRTYGGIIFLQIILRLSGISFLRVILKLRRLPG